MEPQQFLNALIDLLLSPLIAVRRFFNTITPPPLPPFLATSAETVPVATGVVTRTATGPTENAVGRLRQYSYSVSDSRTKQEIRDTTGPWISFSVLNDGPGDVEIFINDANEGKPVTAKNGETINIDFKKPVVNKLYVRLLSGASSTGRIYGKR